jgi:hypothetical protein
MRRYIASYLRTEAASSAAPSSMICSAASGRASAAGAGRGEEFAQLGGEPVPGERVGVQDASGPGFGQCPGIGGLVIVRGVGIGDEERGQRGHRELRDGQRARAAQREVGPAVAARHVGLEVDYAGLDSRLRVRVGHPLAIRGARLVEDREIRRALGLHGFDHGFVDLPGSLAAAEDEQAEGRSRRSPRGILAEGLDQLLAQRDSGRANPIAGGGLGEDPGGGVELDEHEPGDAGRGAVGPTRHSVGLHEHHGDAAQPGGGDRGDRRVASDRDHDVAPERAESLPRRGAGAQDGGHGGQPPREAPAHDLLRRQRRQLDPRLGNQACLEAALGPHEQHGVAPGLDAFGQGQRRGHVPAGSPARDDPAPFVSRLRHVCSRPRGDALATRLRGGGTS